MHPSLEREHPDCQEVIENLNQCHADNPFAKFLGACNDPKIALDQCFRAEKIRMRTANLERAKKSDAYVRQKMQEHRERRRDAAADASAA